MRAVEVFADVDALSEAAAELIARAARAGVVAHGRFSLVLAGGDTPRRTYEVLAEHHGESVPWHAVEVFFGDERHVPPDDARSNYGMAQAAFLSRVPIPPANVFPILTAALSVEESAEAYDALLRARAGGRPPVVRTTPSQGASRSAGRGANDAAFDLVVLGVGEDGHTASLFAGSPGLSDPGRWAMAVEAPEGVQPRQRVTLTLAALGRATVVLVLCAGERKRRVVHEILTQDPDDSRLPAAHIRALGEVRWMLDDAAAGAGRE